MKITFINANGDKVELLNQEFAPRIDEIVIIKERKTSERGISTDVSMIGVVHKIINSYENGLLEVEVHVR